MFIFIHIHISPISLCPHHIHMHRHLHSRLPMNVIEDVHQYSRHKNKKHTHTHIYIYLQRYRCRCRTWCRCRYKRTELSESDTEDFDPIPGSSERLCTTSLQRLVGPRMAAWRLRPALRWLPLAGAMPLCRGSLALCGYARPTPLEERALRRQTLVCVSPFAAVHFRRHIAWVSCARPWLSLKRKLTQSEPCA